MTKHPAFSSATGWHQDIRYWSFERPELVSVWLALGRENADNGCLWLVPGSHCQDFPPEQYDTDRFFRDDLDVSREILSKAIKAELDEGDVLFFHCRLLHRAGRNTTDQTKLAVVFTYHATENHPQAGTRSASSPEVTVLC